MNYYRLEKFQSLPFYWKGTELMLVTLYNINFQLNYHFIQ